MSNATSLTCPLFSATQDTQPLSESSQASAPSGIAQRSDSSSRAPDGQHALSRPKSGLQQPHPNSLIPSASSPRPKLIFEMGSVSDSGVASRTPRSSACLGVSLGYKGRPSLLDVRHPSPSSPNLSLPGYLSDSCILEHSASPLHASRLDVKRLLSKPAAPSVASALSIASDTDPEPHALSRSPLNSSKAWPSKARVQAQPKAIIDPPTISRSESSERKSLASQPPSLQQRPRVLRKKSTSGQNRTVVSATPRNDTSTLSQLQSKPRHPAAGPSSGPRSTPLQSLIRSRATVSPSAPPSGSGRLTPAGAIAQAYKEQGIRREALAAAANADTVLPAIPVSASLLDSFEQATSEQNNTANVKSAPWCTGPRDSSDSFVLVDNAQEALCSGVEHNQRVGGSGGHSVSACASRPAKSLTRKVSAPLQRSLAAVNSSAGRSGRGQTDDEITPACHLRGNIDSGDRRERQRSLSFHKAKRKSDSPGVSLKAPLNGDLEDSSGERSVYPSLTESASNSTNVLAQSKDKDKLQDKGDTGTGVRLWRLVKRISTGGLRERFQMANAPPPPVPTIPKGLTMLPNAMLEVQAPSESASRDGGTDTGYSAGGGNGGMSPNNSSDVSPQSDGPTSLQGNGAGSLPRYPSISSSPQSSEPTTSIHFFRSHSSRSSFSSFAGTSPPPPVPKHSLARSSSLQTRTRTRTNTNSSSSTQGTSHDEAERSTEPPTRTWNRSSPDIPSFSISDVVNNFMLRRPSLARHQARQARHAPARSLPRIEPPPSGEVSGALLRRAGSEARTTTRKHRRFDPILAPVSSGQNRDSHGSDSTLRPPGSVGSNSGSVVERITFRELGSAQGQVLTSQEKEDKWDDLLERSARAGGTLHLGAGSSRLASDNLRFSSSTLELEV